MTVIRNRPGKPAGTDRRNIRPEHSAGTRRYSWADGAEGVSIRWRPAAACAGARPVPRVRALRGCRRGVGHADADGTGGRGSGGGVRGPALSREGSWTTPCAGPAEAAGEGRSAVDAGPRAARAATRTVRRGTAAGTARTAQGRCHDLPRGRGYRPGPRRTGLGALTAGERRACARVRPDPLAPRPGGTRPPCSSCPAPAPAPQGRSTRGDDPADR